jgi:DUF177 domain-containing protein
MPGFRIDVADLLAHPGSRRALDVAAEVDDLARTAAVVEGPVRLALTLERIPEGIVARGTVSADWRAECSACLRDFTRTLEVHVDELFEATPVDGETYPIEGHEIDLVQLIRDAVLLELPLAPVCDDSCEPPMLGDVDDAPADARETDPRWAALAELEL